MAIKIQTCIYIIFGVSKQCFSSHLCHWMWKVKVDKISKFFQEGVKEQILKVVLAWRSQYYFKIYFFENHVFLDAYALAKNAIWYYH